MQQMIFIAFYIAIGKQSATCFGRSSSHLRCDFYNDVNVDLYVHVGTVISVCT